MSKNLLWLLILFVILTGCTSYVPLTLNDTIDDVVLINFYFWMEELDFPGEEDVKGEFDILTLFRLKEIYDDIIEDIEEPKELFSNKEFLESIYHPIENGLKNELSIPLQPLEKYEYDFHPDSSGFFLYDARFVVAGGEIDATINILVDINFPSTQTSESTWGGVTKIRTKGKPKLTLDIEMVDRYGKVLWKDSVTARSDEWMVVESKWLMDAKYKHSVTGPSVVELARQAVMLLVEKNKNL